MNASEARTMQVVLWIHFDADKKTPRVYGKAGPGGIRRQIKSAF